MADADATGGARRSRRLLLGGGLAAGGSLVASGTWWAAGYNRPSTTDSGPGSGSGSARETGWDREQVPFHGARQAGVEAPAQAHAAYVGLSLHSENNRGSLIRLLELWTDDAARLTRGEPALADTEPELARRPARLTVTVGFGPRVFDIAERSGRRPSWLAPLPTFAVDRLDDRWRQADLLVQVAAEDPVTVAHTVRMLVKDARTFASVRWTQQGFRYGAGVGRGNATQRNLMGHLDGTANPEPGTDEFEQAVWGNGRNSWDPNGTGLVLRRIRIELETWDELGIEQKEDAIGRRLDTGAPLGGQREDDPLDLDATGPSGLPVVPPWAHARRAHVSNPAKRIFRRFYNYDQGHDTEGKADVGLLFASYQADVTDQFIPLQRRLDELDLLNDWTTPIGSAVFAVPPGVEKGEWWGRSVLA